MVRLEVRCPICSTRGYIEVSEEEVKSSTRGLFAVNITEEIVCSHSFIAYVDKNLAIRDTYTADFQIQLPEILPKEEEEADKSITGLIDISLIKLNLTVSNIAFIFRAMIYRKKILFISNQDFLFEKIKQFFDYITQNSYELDLQFIDEANFRQENYNDYVILKGNSIINDPDHIFEKQKLNVEKTIAQRFTSEYDPDSSLIIIRNEVQKTYKLSKSIIEIVKNLKKDKKVYSKQLIDDLEKKHRIKIYLPYLDFLYEIVEHYFNVEIPKSSNISNFLGTL